ncbi:MAG: hypothetical protein IKV48_05920, partial [Eggerthellaceae bacterium]|nr:hypothetical protein [Eggerthellaceae bacterium]
MAASKLQRHFLKLLCELDELCRQQGVAYSLAEHSAWDAAKFHEYHGGMYDTCVMMTEDAVARFKDALAKAGVADRLVVADGVGA